MAIGRIVFGILRNDLLTGIYNNSILFGQGDNAQISVSNVVSSLSFGGILSSFSSVRFNSSVPNSFVFSTSGGGSSPVINNIFNLSNGSDIFNSAGRISFSDILSSLSQHLNVQINQTPNGPTNQAPVLVNSIGDQTATEDQLFAFTLAANTFNDPENSSQLALSATLADGSPLPSWLSFNPNTGEFSGTPEQAHVGDLIIRVTATDSGGLTTFDDFVISVAHVNDPPTVQTGLSNQNATEDQLFTFEVPISTFIDEEDGANLTLSATLPDGSPLPGWLTFDGSQLSGTPLQGDVGDITVRVTATDAGGLTTFSDFVISVAEVNDPPTVQTGLSNQNATEDQLFTFEVPTSTFTDEEDGANLTLSATLPDGSPLPGWLTFDGSQLSGTPLQGDVGDITVRVTATDAGGLMTFSDFVISVAEVNDPPTVDHLISDKNAVNYQSFDFILPSDTFGDEEGSLVLSATLADGSPLPSWLTFNPNTGQFSGTPLPSDLGDLIIRVTATDLGGLETSDNFVLSVHDSLNIALLDGSNGFTLTGINTGQSLGFDFSVSGAGDVNGDGLDDFLIGAAFVEPNGIEDSGATYLIFGQSSGFPANVNLTELNGSNGVMMTGINVTDLSGASVSGLGDINGDGFDDIIIGAPFADPNGVITAGQSYVIFGTNAGFSSTLSLADLNGNNGFTINGINQGDFSANRVSRAGDINGDGFDDIIISAFRADPNGVSFAGQSYVIFGSDAGFSSTFELSDLNGTNGFTINGIALNDISGRAISHAGDINGDGFDDIIIGASQANSGSGQSYVVFGSDAGFAPSIELGNLDGSNGFTVNGISGSTNGVSVSGAGDINGDGLDDIIIGANTANNSIGESYVIFGSNTGFAANVDITNLNGSNGFVVKGIDENTFSGSSVRGAGDFNGDGFDDFLIGVPRASPDGVGNAGQTYLIFGQSGGFAPTFNLADVNGINGFIINGTNTEDRIGSYVSAAGDVNGDGFDDLLLGSYVSGSPGSGRAFIIYGRAIDDAPSGLNVADTFVFTTNDVEMNTQPALIDNFEQGLDQIDISDFGFVDTSNFGITEVDGSSFIDLNNDTQQDIQVQGVTGLSDSDFIF